MNFKILVSERDRRDERNNSATINLKGGDGAVTGTWECVKGTIARHNGGHNDSTKWEYDPDTMRLELFLRDGTGKGWDPPNMWLLGVPEMPAVKDRTGVGSQRVDPCSEGACVKKGLIGWVSLGGS